MILHAKSLSFNNNCYRYCGYKLPNVLSAFAKQQPTLKNGVHVKYKLDNFIHFILKLLFSRLLVVFAI